MIPNPPLGGPFRRDDELAVNRWTLIANLVGGILAPCCACHQSSATYWEHGGRYTPLHERCVDHLIREWREMVAHGEADAPPPAERPMGAYARRAAARAVERGDRPTVGRAVSVNLGSPYFIPGMAEGTPWTAVAEMPDGIRRISPAGDHEAHARRVCALWRAAAARGFVDTFGGQLPVRGYVVDPTGARSDEWATSELASRVDSASLSA